MTGAILNIAGTILNVAGILVGGIVGLVRRRPLSPALESQFKVGLGVCILFCGLRLTWVSLSGSFPGVLRQLVIVILALVLGKIAGQMLRLQVLSNQVGKRARRCIEAAKPGEPGPAGEGFKTCAALFCAAPLGILGAIQEGLTSPPYVYPLTAKAVMDGLATMGFASLFGRGVLLAAVPVLAFQGTITLAGRVLLPFLSVHNLVNPVNATGGLLVFCVALVLLGIKRIELADYLPSLLFAPLITWLWR
jgi:uncharacterized protein